MISAFMFMNELNHRNLTRNLAILFILQADFIYEEISHRGDNNSTVIAYI